MLRQQMMQHGTSRNYPGRYRRGYCHLLLRLCRTRCHSRLAVLVCDEWPEEKEASLSLTGAACAGYDPKYWDTSTRDGRTTRLGSVKIAGKKIPRVRQFALAKAICGTCPVITSCLMIGMNETEGIWGGKLPEER